MTTHSYSTVTITFPPHAYWIAIALLRHREVEAGRVLEPLRNKRTRIGQISDELVADRDHRLDQRLAVFAADEWVGGFDNVAVAGTVLIHERDAAVSQSVRGDHALITAMSLAEREGAICGEFSFSSFCKA